MTTLTKDELNRLAGGNPKVAEGIKTIIQDNISFMSFERSINILLRAKSERYLGFVEAGLQITMQQIQKMYANHSPYMAKDKTALYLYTLQQLIMNLGQWFLPNEKPNHYQSLLWQKYQRVKSKGQKLGLEDDVIDRECYTTKYQNPQDPVLQDFKFLDEQLLENLERRLRRYQITQDPTKMFEQGS